MDKDWLKLYGCLPSPDNPHKLNRCACEESDLECKRHPELAASQKKTTAKTQAYCQGSKRHGCDVGSPMHDQLLERGCFHCGAFPE